MPAAEWQRREGGYLRKDGAWFLERGARMSTGGTNAWLIMRRVGEDRIGDGTYSYYDEKTGGPLWHLTDDGYVDTTSLMPEGERPDLYAHDLDAGSLAEAKYTVETVEANERTIAEARAKIAGSDAIGGIVGAMREADARRAR